MSGDLRSNLKAIRTRLGLSQKQLAEAAGITRQTVGGIEAGLYAPSAQVALRLARALDCTVEEIFWLEGEGRSLSAEPAGEWPSGERARCALARIRGAWRAFPLAGEDAFRTEMTPADGVGTHSDAHIQVQLLDEPEGPEGAVVVAGCAPELSLWARAAERWLPGTRVHWTHANSTEGLRRLAAGDTHAAGVHIAADGPDADNVEAVQRALPGEDVALVHLGLWQEGILSRKDRPVHSVGDLVAQKARLMNREPGSGARMLLDAALKSEGVAHDRVLGYEQCARGHVEVARTVASGAADAGISTAAVAQAFGLAFAPLRHVSYDLAVPAAYLDEAPVHQALTTLQHRWVRSQLAALGGFDTGRTGEVRMIGGS